MQYETIRIEPRGDGVAWLVLNRPDKHNAMSGRMLDDLQAAATALAADETVRAVVLTGEGASFCAGGDLDWMRQQFEAIASGARGAGDEACPHAARAQRTAQAADRPGQRPGLRRRPWHDERVRCGGRRRQREIRLHGDASSALSPQPSAPMSWRGWARRARRQVFMSARMFGASEAKELGLVAKVVPADGLDGAIEAEVKPYLSCSPAAVAQAKALIRHMAGEVDEPLMRHTAARLADCWEGDAREGVSAFFEKRPPAWKTEG